MMQHTACLVNEKGKSFPLTNGSNIIGRNYPEKLDNNKISRKHVEINFSQESGVLTIIPLSENPVGILSYTGSSQENEDGVLLKIKKGQQPYFIRANENVRFSLSLLPTEDAFVYKIQVISTEVQIDPTCGEDATQLDTVNMDLDFTILEHSKKRSGSDLDGDLPQKRLFKRHNSTPRIDPASIHILCKISAGSCGEVYKATWLGTTVAVKKIYRSLLHEDAIEEFESETNILKTVRHPNVVLFLGVSSNSDSSNGEMCLITEFMSRGSLHHVLKDKTVKLDTYAKICIAYEAAAGMNYLHKHNPPIIHRDLKSHNLLVDDSLTVKVTDFGLAKYLNSDDDNNNTFCGTLPWTAPEIFRAQGYTVKADVYSFGIVLWEIITRGDVYRGLNKPDIILGVTQNTLRPQIPTVCHPGISELMKMCWDDDPNKRPTFEYIVDSLDKMRKVEKENRLSKDEIDIGEVNKPILTYESENMEIGTAEYRGQQVQFKRLITDDVKNVAPILRQELKQIMDLRTPNISLFYGFSLSPYVLLICEDIKERNLLSLLQDPSVIFNWNIAVRLALEIAKGIRGLHNWKPSIVLKCLKSSNIHVNETFSVKIAGLEESRFYGKKVNVLKRLGEDAIYEAPEILIGHDYSVKSDIYSFSIILWEIAHKCITGKYVEPYQRDVEMNELYNNISLHNLRPTINGLCPNVLVSIIQRCWDADPRNRLSCDDVITHLNELLETI